MKRLSRDMLSSLPSNVSPPPAVSLNAQEKIVHLGIGAFHRAHQAVFTQEASLATGEEWGICAASLRSSHVRDLLKEQDYLFTIATRGRVEEDFRIIGIVQQVFVAQEDPRKLVEKMADPVVTIVSLTITEKGYYYDSVLEGLQEEHPDILHDIDSLETPKTAIGFIVSALKRRFDNNRSPFTVLSCDNLPHNGKIAQRIITRFAFLVSEELGKWVENSVSFPCTMVDRIVPASRSEDIEWLEEKIGIEDQAAVFAEPFTQWVIEDNFCNDRPIWEKGGALLVKDVAPFEEMKLRLLNGSHSTLAYLGYLAGYEYMDQVMENDYFRKFIRHNMEYQVLPTLNLPSTIDIFNYMDTLVDRFSNPNLSHRTWQIAMDGSQKLAPRLLLPVRQCLSEGRDIEGFAMGIAAWMRYVMGRDEQGKAIEISDPMASVFQEISEKYGDNPELYVSALMGISEIFGDDLPLRADFVTPVRNIFEALLKEGACSTVESFVHRHCKE